MSAEKHPEARLTKGDETLTVEFVSTAHDDTIADRKREERRRKGAVGSRLLVAPEPWMVDAACTSVDPELFFPTRGESVDEAKAVCRGCPVRGECLEYALGRGEKYGLWGGASERERRRMRRQRRGE